MAVSYSKTGQGLVDWKYSHVNVYEKKNIGFLPKGKEKEKWHISTK